MTIVNMERLLSVYLSNFFLILTLYIIWYN